MATAAAPCAPGVPATATATTPPAVAVPTAAAVPAAVAASSVPRDLSKGPQFQPGVQLSQPRNIRYAAGKLVGGSVQRELGIDGGELARQFEHGELVAQVLAHL